MNFLHTALAFLFALGVLIVFHELGHYFVARMCNVKVLRFSVGMGKVVYSRRFGKDQTEWVVSMLPLGGYVKMLDLREHDEETSPPISSTDLEREFTGQSVWKRIAIVAAGPVANFILAIVLFTLLFMIGVPEPIAKLRAPNSATVAYQSGVRGQEMVNAVNGKSIQLWSELRWELLQYALEKQPVTLTISSEDKPRQTREIKLALNQLSAQDLEADFMGKLGLNLALSKAQLGTVNPDSPARRAGLETGDIVIQIDEKKIADGLELIDIVRSSPNKLLHVVVDRSGETKEFSVTPDAVMLDGKLIGKLNVEVRSAPDMLDHQDTLFTALEKAAGRTWSTSVLTLKMIGKMLLGEVSIKNITGPLTIADYAGQTAKSGATSYLSFLAFVSISLGVMNLLPIPILDGGHLLYYALEVFTGRPISQRASDIAQRVGLAMLMLLMAIAFFNDIARLLPFRF